ncbi:MAG: hypothetical protein HFH87_08365 [Lachnospiraceae bacterium]|nr:hypothetical protein [Lachnospiraceae bacterium]
MYRKMTARQKPETQVYEMKVDKGGSDSKRESDGREKKSEKRTEGCR